MYTFSEIQIIFNNCTNWQDLEKVSECFGFLIKEDWIKSETCYNAIVALCDDTFRRIENL